MPHPIPYLGFDGTCLEAMRFYEQALNGKLELVMRMGEDPGPARVPAEFADRIMHARLALPGGGMIYAGDCPPHMPFHAMQGLALTLNYDTVEEARRVIDALAEGGRITAAPQRAFWAELWAMLTDRFGTAWIVNGRLASL